MASSLVPVKGQPGKFFNKLTGAVVDIVEWREDDKYDTVTIPAGAIAAGTTRNFFRDLQNKATIDCNFTTQRKLPAGEEMIIDRIWCYVPMAAGNTLVSPADIKRVAENGYVRFQINRKDVAEGPVVKFPAGYGLAGNTVETDQGIVSIGVPSTAAAAKLVREQLVTEKHDLDAVLFYDARTWDGTIAMPTLTSTVHVKAGFHGLVRSAATKG